MKKPKRGQPVGDRLSELPDSLIFNIFRFLPLKYVVRTSVLSKRYENLWKTVPFLNFDSFSKKSSIRKFITWAVMKWRGSKILKLKIGFGTRLNKLLYDDIDLLVGFGKEFGVEELNIHFKNVDSITEHELYRAPQGLYSCSSIERLYLQNCDLPIPTINVRWNRLEYLRIDGYFVSQDLINKILCGSPNLEYLILCFTEKYRNLSIQSNSLRYVYIYKFLWNDTDAPSEVTELRISTPKLQHLEVVGVPYSKFTMKDAPLLTLATISFHAPNYYRHRLFSGNDFVGKALDQILPTILRVEELILSHWCIKALGDVKYSNMLSPFPNVKKLILDVHLEEYKKVARLLKLFPQLEKLVIEKERVCSKRHDGGESVDEFEADFPNSFLQKLRTITIAWGKAKGKKWLFPFIKILLKYASNLNRMKFRSSNSSLLQSASTKVPRMRRSSPSADFIFCE